MAYGRFRRSYGRRRMGNTFRRGARTYGRYGRRRRGRRSRYGGLKIEINHKDMTFTADPVVTALDSTALITPTDVAGPTAMTHITEVSRGDAEEQRVGGRYKCISLEIKGNLTQKKSTLTIASGDQIVDNHVHVALVEKKNTQGTQIVPSNVFDNILNPLRVHDQVDDYKVIWHKEIKFHAAANNMDNDGTNFYSPAEKRDFHMYTKLWQQVDFANVATGAITDCRTSSLHLFCWKEAANSATEGYPVVALDLRGRLRFIDC